MSRYEYINRSMQCFHFSNIFHSERESILFKGMIGYLVNNKDAFGFNRNVSRRVFLNGHFKFECEENYGEF